MRMHTVVNLTPEEIGWLLFACRMARKKDDKGAAHFGEDLDPDSGIAGRVRVGKTAHEKLKNWAKGQAPTVGLVGKEAR